MSIIIRWISYSKTLCNLPKVTHPVSETRYLKPGLLILKAVFCFVFGLVLSMLLPKRMFMNQLIYSTKIYVALPPARHCAGPFGYKDERCGYNHWPHRAHSLTRKRNHLTRTPYIFNRLENSTAFTEFHCVPRAVLWASAFLTIPSQLSFPTASPAPSSQILHARLTGCFPTIP